MNRRTFLSALAATSLTPFLPGPVIAPARKTYFTAERFNAELRVMGEDAPPYLVPGGHRSGWHVVTGKTIADVGARYAHNDLVYEIFAYGDGTDRESGLLNAHTMTVTRAGTGAASWSEKTPADIAEDIQRGLAAYRECEPPDRIVLPKNRQAFPFGAISRA